MQKINKTIFLITIVLVSLLCLTAVSAASDDAVIAGDSMSADNIIAAESDIAVTASEDAQTVDNINDASYETLGVIANDTGDLDQNTKAVSGSDILTEGETNSFTNLANSINNAGSYLSLSGNYAYDSTLDTEYANGITISKDITINGGRSTTISGSDLARIFNIGNGFNVVLLDITFINGSADNGGAIYNDGNLVLRGCEFQDNSADYGAAIYNSAYATLTGDAKFEGNEATYRGGGIYSEGTVDLSDSVFDSNDITYRAKNDDNGGAAIYNNGGTLTLNNTQVTNNLLDIVIRDGNAGHLVNAVLFTSGDATITNSYFYNNSGSWGGAIYVTNDATLDVSGTTFEKNMATFGAAIYDEGAKVIVDDCDFIENHCEGIGSAGTSSTQAAAILVMSQGASATVTNSRFNKNSAKVGGAISFSLSDGASLIDNCKFTENVATEEGGAIYNNGWTDEELTVSNSEFTNNRASEGSAIYNNDRLALSGNTITGGAAEIANAEGWGDIISTVKVVILDGQDHTVTNPAIDLTAAVTDDNNNPIIDANFVFTVGAEEVPASYDATEGIYKATYTFKNPGTYTISTDSYTLDDVTDSVITFKSSLSSLKSLIDENTNGTLDLTYGFLYDDELDSAIKISGIAINKDITINGNGVTLSGADVARLFEINSGFTLTLNNLIISNFVSNYGPAAYVHNGATLNSNNVNYNNNIANANGGAIYSEYGNLVIIGSTFTNNEAKGTYGTSTGVGSAIYDFAGINPGTTTYITDSTFTNNAGTGTKAGVYVDNAVITGSTFTNTVIFAMRKASISNDVFDNEGNDIHLSTNTGFVFYDGTGDLPVLSKATINYTGTSFQGLQDIITNSDYGTKTLNIGLHNDITKLADEEFANGIVIDKKVLINGIGHTLDVNGQGKAFYISEGAELSLLDMNIVGDGTSAIVNDGILKDYNPTKPITFTNAGEYPIDNDEGIITINFNTKTFTQLNSVISLISGGTINTSSTKVTKGDDEKETFADGITITQKDLSIISSNKNYQRTIDADNSGRIFNVADGASLTLKNINLQNGNAADGGAVYVSEGAKLFAESTQFLNNKATYSGGAIYATGATVSLDNCILDNNDATDHSKNNDTGGAVIYAEDSTVTISKTKVTNNGDKTLNRTKGDLINGVLNLHDSTTTITDSVFENNTGIYGGAITAETTKDEGVSKLTISGTNFTSNAAYTGGAVYVADTEFDISDSIFDANNKASGEGSTGYTAGGGALVIMSGSEGTLDNVTVKNSHASQGGAIDLENSQATITGSKFESNSADGWAGAIYATGNSALTVEDSSFEANTAAAATIVTFGATTSTIKDSNFTNNYDTYNWGVVTVYGTGDVNIEGSKFTKDVEDTYTVDVYVVDDAKVSIKDSTFDTNSYYSIVAEDGQLTLEGNDIKSDYVPIYTVADAEIVSTVKAKILANDTYNWHMAGYEITSTLTDDAGNLIRDANFKFVLTSEGIEPITIDAIFDGVNELYKANFTPTESGTYLISLDYSTEDVETSVLKISRTLTDLASIIAADEDGTIELDGDYSYVAGFDEALVDGIVIDKAVTINGNGFAICGEDTARLFNVTSNVLTLNNLVICDGAAEKGAGVYVDAGAGLIADGVTFTENVAVKRGGAIYSEGTVDIKNSVIDSNNITFRTKNDDNGGAAIYNLNGVLNIEKTNITNNLKDIVIRNGNAGDLLVGVVVTSGETTIIDSYFANNTGSWGGAISSLGYLNDDPYTLTVTGTTFEGNNATFGGAIYVESSNLVVDDCTFNNNKGVGVGSSGTSNTQGGAIVIHPRDSKATITNSRFNKNSANIGGAVSLAGVDQDSLIEGCTFTENTANDGGAIYLWTQDDAAVTVKDSTFSGNTAGWGNAISTDGALKLEGNTISTTSADIGNWGGSIESKLISVIMDNQTINTAKLGDTVKLYATLTDDKGNWIRDNNLQFNVNGEIIHAKYDSETGLYEADYLIASAGDKVVNITNIPETNLETRVSVLEIEKANVTQFEVIPGGQVNKIPLGENVTVYVSLTGVNGIGLNETITVIVNNTEYLVEIIDGEGKFDVSGLESGDYAAFSMFESDNYNRVYATGTFTVLRTDAELSVAIEDTTYGSDAVINVALTDGDDGLTGIVVVTIGEDQYVVPVINGEGSLAVSGLAVDDYAYTAEFTGDNVYAPVTQDEKTFKVKRASTAITIDAPDEITYGDALTIDTELTSGGKAIAGEVKVVVTDASGNVFEDLNNLAVGTYTITATFAESGNYLGTEATKIIEVKQASSDVTAKANATLINFGDSVTVTIEGLPEDVPVTDLNITDNGNEITVTLNGNEFVYTPAESGDHVIAINYNGTAYDKFYAETSFTVAPEGEYTVIPANNSAEAVQEAINNAPAGATIKLADNTTYDLAGIELNNSVTIVGGEGTVITVPAGQSSAFVAAANASDVNIKNIKFVATSDNQSLLSVTPNDLGGGISQVPAITIENVTAIPAAGVNESTISLLNVNTSSNPFKPSSDVSISKNIIASGVNSLKTNASALSGNVALKKAVQTTLTGANTQKVYAIPYKAAKSGKYYTVTLKDKNGNVLANKTVKFTLAGKTYTVKTDAKGVAKLAINIYKPGTYKLAVSFAGESTLGASSKQATIKILKNKVKITRKTKKVKRSAKKRTLKYYVKTKTGKKMGIKGVKVYLKINKKTYKAKTNKKGLVKFKVKLPRIKKTYKVKVTFKGNKANKKRTLKTKVKVY